MKNFKKIDFKWAFGKGTSKTYRQEEHLPDPDKGPYHFSNCTFHKRIISTVKRDYKGSQIQEIEEDLSKRKQPLWGIKIWEMTYTI